MHRDAYCLHQIIPSSKRQPPSGSLPSLFRTIINEQHYPFDLSKAILIRSAPKYLHLGALYINSSTRRDSFGVRHHMYLFS